MLDRVRAIIIEKDKILLIKRIKTDETYWVLPGGAVESSETHEQALQREGREELGLKLRIIRPFVVRLSDKPETLGYTEHFYVCAIEDGALGTGQGPEFQRDTKYVGRYEFHWVVLCQLSGLELKPKEVKQLIIKEFLEVDT